jgi:nucleoside phosphorylase/CheY-like chemotaxis protein
MSVSPTFTILVVDDNESKVARIVEVVEATCGGEAQCTIASSANAAISKLVDNEYDLVVLDVMLPMRAEGEPRRDGGVAILDAMLRQGRRLRRPKRIIGLTGFSDIHSQLVKKFSDEGIQLLLYSDDSESWIGPLSNAISYQLGLDSPVEEGYRDDVCIITALREVELEAVLSLPGEWVSESVDGDATIYFRGVFNSNGKSLSVVAAASIETGMPAAACLAAKMISTFRPRFLCMCGITAGIGLECGDIIVADRTWDYGSGKYTTNSAGNLKFLPEPRQIPASEMIVEQIGTHIATKSEAVARIQAGWRSTKPTTVLQVKMGPMASGAGVIEHQAVIDEIREQNRKTIAVEMEAFGIFMAARTAPKPQPIPIVIKSMSDAGTVPKTDDYQRYAAYTSANYLYEILTNCLP